MPATADDLRTALDDLHFAARHLVARPTNTARRLALKRACDRAKALRDAESAARRALDSVPPGDRPEPPDPVSMAGEDPDRETVNADEPRKWWVS